MAHNPEVEGSNPSPATKARGPFSNKEKAFCMRFVPGCLRTKLAELPELDNTPDTEGLRLAPQAGQPFL